MLQVVLGLDAKRIAAAFLTSPAAMSKRLVRAKEKIRTAGIPFSIPEPQELQPRVSGVLETIYAAWSEGWVDPIGLDGSRRDLAEEAIYLARIVAELLPEEPEAAGLLALLLYSESRRRARRDERGEYVPMAAQDPALWDERLIAEAEAWLRRASQYASTGRYQIEAAIQSAHVARRLHGQIDWRSIVALYDLLLIDSGSLVVAINRALAIAELEGPQQGLAVLPEERSDPRLASYQPYWAARAAMLAQAGEVGEAASCYRLAIGLESDPAVRRFLERKLAAVDGARQDDAFAKGACEPQTKGLSTRTHY